MNGFRLYLRYAGISIRSQMQYRASFVMMSIGHGLVTGIEFLGVWALFARFGSLREWTLPEIALFYGMISIAFAIAEAVPRGFDQFHLQVKSGDFDRLLVRPRSTALQVGASELQLMRIGRLVQGLAVLLYGAWALGIEWTPGRVVLLLCAIAGGACLFSGLFILQATLAFWTVESIEIANILTYGGVEAAQFPVAIYRTWFRRIFTFLVPLATINYYPAHAILGRPDSLGSPVLFQWLSPVVGVLFLLVCLGIWDFGVRHYRSTGS